ncbi:MAG: cytidine deaminase [Candidatus Delongbacteria bacterium]|nr:cytidine deaminase [Candidatus Delongbacteria bacterium]
MSLSDLHSELYETAHNARENASAIYSNFKVGAALRTKSGKIYFGSNIESSSFGLSICAERVALFTALSNGEREFDTIFILSNSEIPASPCGACRQLLYDYAPELNVIMSNLKKEIVIDNIKNLLKNPFSLSS